MTVLTKPELEQRKRAADLKKRIIKKAEAEGRVKKEKNGTLTVIEERSPGGGQEMHGAYHKSARVTPLDALTEKRRLMARYVAEGKPALTAARMAGLATPEVEAYRVTRDPVFIEAVQFLRRQHEAAGAMTRKKVMDGFAEAIDMARTLSDAGNMIAGWREIAKMCGYYAPEVKKIDLNITTKRVMDQLETMSMEQLAEIIEGSAEVIDETPLMLDMTTSEPLPEGDVSL